MNAFLKKHPALNEACDTVLSLLSVSFSLPATGVVWIREQIIKARR